MMVCRHCGAAIREEYTNDERVVALFTTYDHDDLCAGRYGVLPHQEDYTA